MGQKANTRACCCEVHCKIVVPDAVPTLLWEVTRCGVLRLRMLLSRGDALACVCLTD